MFVVFNSSIESIVLNTGDRAVYRGVELSSNRTIEILMWTAMFGVKNNSLLNERCTYKCALSFDHDRLPYADAVVIHGFDFNASDMPDERNRKPLSVNVFLTMESFNSASKYHNLLNVPGFDSKICNYMSYAIRLLNGGAYQGCTFFIVKTEVGINSIYWGKGNL